MLSRLRELDRVARALEKRLSALKRHEEVKAYLFLSDWGFWRGMLVLIALFFGVIGYGAVASLGVKGIDYPAPVNAFRFSMMAVLACMFAWFVGREKASYYKAKGYSPEWLRFSKAVQEYRKLSKVASTFNMAGAVGVAAMLILLMPFVALIRASVTDFAPYAVFSAILAGWLLVWHYFYRRAERYLGDVEVRSVVFSNSAYGLLGGGNAAQVGVGVLIPLAVFALVGALLLGVIKPTAPAMVLVVSFLAPVVMALEQNGIGGWSMAHTRDFTVGLIYVAMLNVVGAALYGYISAGAAWQVAFAVMAIIYTALVYKEHLRDKGSKADSATAVVVAGSLLAGAGIIGLAVSPLAAAVMLAAGIVLGVYYGVSQVETRNAARVSTAGAIILASGLVIAALMRMLGIPLWQFFVVVGAGIVLLIAIVFLNGGVLSWFLGRCRRKRSEEKITWSSRDGGGT